MTLIESAQFFISTAWTTVRSTSASNEEKRRVVEAAIVLIQSFVGDLNGADATEWTDKLQTCTDLNAAYGGELSMDTQFPPSAPVE